MCYQPKLRRLIAELDQHLAEVQHGFAGTPPTHLQPTLRSEIVDVLRAVPVDVEWQLTQSRIELVGKTRFNSDRRLSAGTPVGSDLSEENGIINEFIAAPDAELVLESVLRELEAT
jgi:hypothetical protein